MFFFRSQRSRTKPLLSVSPRARSKTKQTMAGTGIGLIGILIPSSTVSSSCSVFSTDVSLFVYYIALF